MNYRVAGNDRVQKFSEEFLPIFDLSLIYFFWRFFVIFVSGKIPEYDLPDEWKYTDKYVENGSMLGQSDDTTEFWKKEYITTIWN